MAEHYESFLTSEKLFNDNKVDFALNQLSVDSEWITPGAPQPTIRGRQQIREMLEQYKKSFPDLSMSTRRILVAGRLIIAQTVTRGTQRQEFFGIPATGKTIGYESVEFKWYRDGKVEKTIQFMNPAIMMRQIAALPGNPPPIPAPPEHPEIVKAPENPTDMTTVRSFYAAIANGDFARIEQIVDDEVVLNDYLLSSSSRGSKALVRELTELRTAFRDYTFSVEEMVSVPPYVAVRGQLRGSHSGQFGPYASTGKELVAHGADILRLENGKITEIDWYRDEFEIARGLGLMPPAPQQPDGDPKQKDR